MTTPATNPPTEEQPGNAGPDSEVAADALRDLQARRRAVLDRLARAHQPRETR